ncbi:MAG TPA: dihydrofolate reductase [Rhizomicrobium sp.]|jgi:dihydrofolate reductase|nr:dihydrofolate reductase [Rhizomicrobium sp.]
MATAERVKMPAISFVVARSEPGHVIGCDNKLPWRLKTDLKNFKKITTDHVVIMGRKTFDSIGRPLPNRINIVLSTRLTEHSSKFPEGNIFFVENRDSALYLADLFSFMKGYKDIFVIGGGVVYEEFKQTFNKIYLTEVYSDKIRGDAFFNYEFDDREWELENNERFPASDDDEFPFGFKIWKKRDLKARERSRFLSSFLTPDENLKEWELQQLEKVKLPRPTFKGPKRVQLELPEVRKIAFSK